jgi:moderate conductance mechanosensitive channel
MDRLSQIVMPGALPVLAAVGLALLLAGAALWSGRFPVKRVRAFLAGDLGSVPVVVEGGRNPVADKMMHDPSRYDFDVGVSCREDPYKVIAILETIGDELRQDSVCVPDVVAPLEILGVDRFEDSAVVIRCRIAAKPTGQQRMRHEISRRLHKAFKQHVVEIPFPSRGLARVNPETWQSPPLYVIVEDKGPAGNGSVSET